jgi:hypothetical protein
MHAGGHARLQASHGLEVGICGHLGAALAARGHHEARGCQQLQQLLLHLRQNRQHDNVQQLLLHLRQKRRSNDALLSA